MSTGEGTRVIALFWDESFLWGVMAAHALADARLPFRLVTAKEIAEGALNHCRALFVPGGWASNKLKALGQDGVARVREFVGNGGTYIGLCGGAGLATNEGLQLIDVRRVPTTQRVPSFSGRIRVASAAHPLWEGIGDPVFYAWWPSQFALGEDITVLARYEEALTDAYSSDLNVGDITDSGSWADWEARYGINLDPARMRDLPAVVTSKYGRGHVIVSLLHFDTPGDYNGAVVLRNLWRLTAGIEGLEGSGLQASAARIPSPPLLADVSPTLDSLSAELHEAVNGLMEFGRRNFLWFSREPSMLLWRRGVRGLEYFSLKVMLDEIRDLITGKESPCLVSTGHGSDRELPRPAASAGQKLENIRAVLLPFVSDARNLLMLERQEMANQKLTYAEAGDPQIVSLRHRLFSSKKSHGGIFKELADRLSDLLYLLITGKGNT